MGMNIRGGALLLSAIKLETGVTSATGFGREEMKTGTIRGVVGLAALLLATGAADAGTVTVGAAASSNTAAQQLSDYAAQFGPGASIVQSGVTGVSGASPSFDLAFGSIATGEAASSLGNFYMGSAAGLNSSGTGDWFSNVAGGAVSLGSDTVVGFGNSGFNARIVTITFNPGVAGFIFNFSDVGDVTNAELEVSWSDGSTSTVATTTSNQPSGYVSLLAAAGQSIASVTLRQTPVANDGFLFYGFTTMAVVPLPPAAWGGLAVLGGMAGVRKLRRR
jgi:hypothetical protein